MANLLAASARCDCATDPAADPAVLEPPTKPVADRTSALRGTWLVILLLPRLSLNLQGLALLDLLLLLQCCGRVGTGA